MKLGSKDEQTTRRMLRQTDQMLSQAITQAQGFLFEISTSSITGNPFFQSDFLNLRDPMGRNLRNTIRDLLDQLRALRERLGITRRGGSRKVRHGRRRKTKRKKKRRRRKTIKRRRKRGRKTRRK